MSEDRSRFEQKLDEVREDNAIIFIDADDSKRGVGRTYTSVLLAQMWREMNDE